MTEILAPAGGEQSAYAAINAGADAVYLGLDKFSARSSAENFDTESFIEIVRYAHAFGVKVYAALNTVIKDGEIESFIKTAVSVWNAGADALIIQDLFLGKYLKDNFPQIKLHLSTQAGTCNAYGASLAKRYGFDRVILARETKLADIEEITKIIETEAFVQGALCTCFSGQCYMSSFAGGNSGNRGRCKQPCRKQYSYNRPGFEEKAYRLSLSDLSVGTQIEKLVQAGVSSFKIEGRMRRPEYVAAAVKYYRNILDGCALQKDFSDLKRTFNRGNYTQGLAFGQDKSLISSSVQGHIGEYAGIIKVENAKYICQSALKFSRGDGFKVLRGGKEVGGGVFGGEAKGGFIVSTRDRLKNGDKVFVTTDTALNERLLSAKRTVALNISASFIAGKPAYAEINGIPFFSQNVLEKCRSRPLTEEEIKRCFEKTDGYPFKITFGKICTDGVFITASALNAFRRSAFAEYYDKITENVNAQVKAEFVLPDIKRAKNAKRAVIATDLNGIRADVGILKLDDVTKYCGKLIEDFKGEKYLYLPPYLTGEEVQLFSEIAESFDGIYCDGYFGLILAEKLNKPFFAGTGFNIANRVTLSKCGAKYICLSKELTAQEADAISCENTFYLTAGDVKVMDLIYCPFGKKCASCDKKQIYTLTDSEGRAFPVRRYRTSECRFEVYNCAPLVGSGGLSGKLFDVSIEENARQITENSDSRTALEKIFKNYTRGHSVTGIY